MPSASVPPTAEPIRALLELAVQELQAGRPAAAITPLRQAALLRPQAAMIHHDLGLACLETGLLQESVDAFRRATACDPRSADAHFRLAISLERLGDLGAALVAYHRATELKPSLTEAWYRAGALVHTLGHRDEAIACFERAAQSGSKTRFGRLGAARALLTAGRDREGERALRACVARDPENPLAHDLLGNLLAEAGLFEEASVCFTRAIALAPLLAGSYYDLVRCRRIVPADAALVARMETALGTPGLDVEHRIRIHLALGKAADDLGEYERAMRYFDAAEAVRQVGAQFPSDQFDREVAQLIEKTTPDLVARAPRLGTPNATPVLIIGMPRSGTTLVEQIISSHPEVRAGGELNFWPTCGARWHDAGAAGNEMTFLRGAAANYSAVIPDEMRARVYGSYGSFDTALIGTTLNTAAPHSSGHTGVMGTIEYSHSDGAMQFSPGDKRDFALKTETLLGEGRLTLFYTYDRYNFYNPGNLTTTDLALYGASFGFNEFPGTPNFYGYSATERDADFGYLKYRTPLGGGAWTLKDRLYTYGYENHGLSLKGDQTSSPIGKGFAGIDPTDIAGKTTSEQYRTYGNDLRVSHRDPYGMLMFGVWAEHDWQNEDRDALDLTTGLLYDANKAQKSPVYFAFDAHLNTVQPYAEYTWQPTSDFDVRLGVRYRAVTRDFDAPVVQNFLPGTDGTVSKTVYSTLPSLDANYRIAEGFNVYAQVSKGSLVPSQSYFYTSTPAAGNQANPETATASQIGIVRLAERYGIALDVYNVNFDNYVTTFAVPNGDTVYENSGTVRYRGVEAEAHLTLGLGFTAVGNASLIRAIFLDSGMTSTLQRAGDTIPYAPNYLALAGVTYQNGPWGGSLLTKFLGTEYQGKNGSADGSTYRVNEYSYTNATATRTFDELLVLKRLRLTAAVNNLFDSDATTDNSGPSSQGPNLINVLAKRNYSLSFAADF